jgi:glycogen operon protein
MILGGDEFRRSQQGNNNGYCQDNELSWFDWHLVEKNADIVRFFRLMIALRKRFSTLHRPTFYDGRVNERGLPDVAWHGCRLGEPGWDDPASQVLSFTLAGSGDEPDLHVILNMHENPLDFELPAVAGREWCRAVDTARPSPDDIAEPGLEQPCDAPSYRAEARSVVVLVNRPTASDLAQPDPRATATRREGEAAATKPRRTTSKSKNTK